MDITHSNLQATLPLFVFRALKCRPFFTVAKRAWCDYTRAVDAFPSIMASKTNRVFPPAKHSQKL
jgi:hypothetical protein